MHSKVSNSSTHSFAYRIQQSCLILLSHPEVSGASHIFVRMIKHALQCHTSSTSRM